MSDKIILYHGSEKILEKPEFGKGKPYNDYGVGFYCTEYVELAKVWACSADHGGYANQYELDSSGLNVLNLNDEKFCILHWLSLLLRNRKFTLESGNAKMARQYLFENFPVDTNGIDLIVGYRANDSYFSYARDFLHNAISVKRLQQVMKLGNLGNQIVLVSPKAFSRLKFIGAEKAERKIYYPLRMKRDHAARDAYLLDKSGDGFNRNDIYLLDVLKESIKADDARLR